MVNRGRGEETWIILQLARIGFGEFIAAFIGHKQARAADTDDEKKYGSQLSHGTSLASSTVRCNSLGLEDQLKLLSPRPK